MFSGFCDMFDGIVARTKKDRTDEEKRFGIQLDSLSDIVCFGVLPFVIGVCSGARGVVADSHNGAVCACGTYKACVL